MKYSVIIPTLNEELYIGRLLGCLVSQDFKDFEVIVVDGKSDDKTREIAAVYKNLLNIKVEEVTLRNVAFQRNHGAKVSRANRLIFMDADGFIRHDFLKKIDSYLEENDVDILTTWVTPLSEKLLDIGMFFAYNSIYGNIISHWKPGGGGAFMLVKKSVFNEAKGFNPNIVVSEDFDLISRATKIGHTFKYLKNPVIQTSVRRIEKEGRLKYALTLAKIGLHYHLIGPIQDSNFAKYTMLGGAWYGDVDENKSLKERFNRLRLKFEEIKDIEIEIPIIPLKNIKLPKILSDNGKKIRKIGKSRKVSGKL